MKRNWYLAYDLLREEKFKTPEKIAIVERALEEHNIVVNWWCRQSGKTLTNIKIIRDLILSKKSNVVVIFPKKSMGSDFFYALKRSLTIETIVHSTTSSVTLANGSKVYVHSSSSDVDFEKIDLLVVEEFEFMDTQNLARILLETKKRAEPSLISRFLNMMKFSKNSFKAIFCSSKKDGKNLEMVKVTFSKKLAITYLNWEKLNFNKEKIEKILGEENFKKEYDSYAPDS